MRTSPGIGRPTDAKTLRLGIGEVESSGVEPVLTSEMLSELRQRLRQSEAREAALLDAPPDEDTIVMSRAELPLVHDPLRPRLGGAPTGFALDWDVEGPTRLGPTLSAGTAEALLASDASSSTDADRGGARFVEPPSPERGLTKRALPTRTWVLLVITVLVTAGWLVTDEPAEPPPEPTVEEQMREEARAAREADRAQARHAGTSTASAPPPEAQQDTLTATASPDRASDGRAERASRERRTLQARAADAYRTGRYEEALRLYHALATEQPDQRAYTVMVRVLSRQLGVAPPGTAPVADTERRG